MSNAPRRSGHTPCQPCDVGRVLSHRVLSQLATACETPRLFSLLLRSSTHPRDVRLSEAVAMMSLAVCSHAPFCPSGRRMNCPGRQGHCFRLETHAFRIVGYRGIGV
eukprot:836876-Heterocapsa_arctica.AAC.1